MKGLDFLRADPKLALYGFAIAFGSSFGQTFFISQFGREIRADFDLTDGTFGVIYGLGTLLSAVVLLYTGSIIDRVDLRRWTLCLVPLCALACLAMGLVVGPVSLFIAIFLLRQTGQGLMSHTSAHSLGRYSRVGRGKAIAVGSYGYPMGEALFPAIGVALIALIGWREVWFGLAGFYLLIFLPLVLFLLWGHDHRYVLYQADLRREEDAFLSQHSGPSAPSSMDRMRKERPRRGQWTRGQWTRKDVLKDWRFYLVIPGLMAPSFIITGLLLHGVRIAELKGWSHELWATSVAAYALGSILLGVLTGIFVDRFGAARGLPFFLPATIVSCMILAWGDGSWAPAAFMATCGMTAGMLSVLMVALWVENYGTKYLGEIKALVTALSVFSSAAAPPLLGLMLDSGWSVTDLAHACAGYAVVGWSLCTLGARSYQAA